MNRRTDPTDWMWAQACDLLDEAQRMHRQFFRLSPRAQAAWEPPVDVYEDEREVAIVVALPGVTADNVEVAVDAGALAVRAERPLPFRGSRRAIRRLEIPYGTFERRIPLPAGRLEVLAHELRNGCLVVHLRKANG